MSFLRSPYWVASLNRTGASGGSSFSPLSIAGIKVWFDGSDVTTMFDATVGGNQVAPNGAVARWEDKSGRAMHLTQSTGGARPFYFTGVKNGLSALRFGEFSSCWMASNDQLSGGELTWFIVLQSATTTADGFDYAISYQEIDSGYESLLDNTMFSSVDTAATYPTATMNAGLQLGWNYATYQRRQNVASTGLITRRNGVQIAAATSNNTALPNRKLGLGAALFSTGVRMNGYIAEVIVYDSFLSASNVATVESYLATKWAI